MRSELKDDVLAVLAQHHNVAQFVSFGPGLRPALRHARIRGESPDTPFADLDVAITALLAQSAGSVNIRSFLPGRAKGNPFVYGVTDSADAAAQVRSLAETGYYTIVNETIDVHDGGISGVALGGVVEFAPDDTPRAVENPGTAALPYWLAMEILGAVYSQRLSFEPALDERIEFSFHPSRIGYRETHTLIWERESVRPIELRAPISWPNRFSRHIGDKTYGLLIADALGLPVPAATAITRRLAPFRFGSPTGTGDIWIRTCPTEQVPGHFTTNFGWTDPFKLLAAEDPSGDAIAAVLAQEGAAPLFSGASLPRDDAGYDYVEGVSGRGDTFMLGERQPEDLPAAVIDSVRQVAARAEKVLGPVRLEWVHDGSQVWVVQMHRSTHQYLPGIISPGDPEHGWLEYHPDTGLETLASLVEEAQGGGMGIIVTGPVGLTSHVGDLLRKAGIPAQLRED